MMTSMLKTVILIVICRVTRATLEAFRAVAALCWLSTALVFVDDHIVHLSALALNQL